MAEETKEHKKEDTPNEENKDQPKTKQKKL